MARHAAGKKTRAATTGAPGDAGNSTEIVTQQDHDVEEEINKLKEELAKALEAKREAEEAKAEADKARSEAEAATKEAEDQMAKINDKSNSTTVIPKPKAGEMSEGADRLRRAMGLADDKAKYLAIQTTVRDLVHQVRLDVQLEYRRQSVKDLGDLFKMARHLQPHLARFQNDWATAEIVKQYLGNRRKNESRKRRLGGARQIEKRRQVDETDAVNSGGQESEEVDDEP